MQNGGPAGGVRALSAGGGGCIALASERIKPGLSFERWLLCPAGTGAFLFLVLAVCAADGRAYFCRRRIRFRRKSSAPQRGVDSAANRIFRLSERFEM